MKKESFSYVCTLIDLLFVSCVYDAKHKIYTHIFKCNEIQKKTRIRIHFKISRYIIQYKMIHKVWFLVFETETR